MHSITGRFSEWFRHHRRLAAAMLSGLVLAGVVPYLVFAVTFSKNTTFIGTVTLTVPLEVASGGTNATSQTTNGVNYYNGTRITSGTGLTFDGTNLGVGTTSPATTFSVVGSGYFTGNVGIGKAPSTLLDLAAANAEGAIQITSTTGTNAAWMKMTNTGGNAYFGIDSSVGNRLGTFADAYALNILTDSARSVIFGTNNTSRMIIDSTGRTAIGTLGTTNVRLRISYNDNTNDGISLRPTDDDSGNAVVFRNTSDGVAGTISVTTSATAYNTSSDRRVKENIATTTSGLDQLMQIPVRDFSFITDKNHATTTGFIAQELRQVFPWAVTTNGDNGIDPLGASSTPWSVDYGRVTPLIVKAVQDIASLSATFKANLIAWFADASNGITDLFAKVGHFHEADVGKLCIGATCVTEDQLKAMLAASVAASSSSSSSSSTSTATTTPGTI